MELTPLESDLIGDLAQDDFDLYEVFEFVRLHHGRDEPQVRSIGRALLASWIARGWLGLAQEGGDAQQPGAASQIGDVLTFIDRAGTLGTEFRGAETKVRLTDRARADVKWLGPAT
jgi:hypothetical protein